MATPYQVPSLSDIMYTRSRTPTPQQVTLNNLMSFLNSAQQIKAEAEAERSSREFTVERDKEERAWRSSEEEKRRAIAQDTESRNRIERRLGRIREDKQRAQDRTTNRAQLVLNHILRDIEAGRFERGEMMAKANQNLFTDADMGQFYENVMENISSGKVERAGKREAHAFANQVVLGNKTPREFLLDKNTIKYADADAYNLVYSKMKQASDKIETYKRMGLEGGWDRLTSRFDSQATLYNQLALDPNNYDEETGNPVGNLLAAEQLLGQIGNDIDNYWPNALKELESTSDKQKRLVDYQYGPNQVREALRIWIEAKAATKEGITDSTGKRMQLADGRVSEVQLDGFMSLLESGKLKSLQTPQGFISDFLTFDQWTKMGLGILNEEDDEDDNGAGPLITLERPGPVKTSFGQVSLDTGSVGGTYVSLQDDDGTEFAAIPWRQFRKVIANRPGVRTRLSQLIGSGRDMYGAKKITYEQVEELARLFY